jgi:spore cortex biosynthesis protein YabQ
MNVPETFFSVHEQLMLFLLSCICGGVVGVFYDIFRTLRIIFPHNTLLVVIEDIIFMCGYAFFISVFSVTAARGEMRVYYIFGNIIGFVVYILTLGAVVTAVMKKLFMLVGGLFSIILCPFKRIYAFLCKKTVLKFVGSSKNSVNYFKNIKKHLINYIGLLYNKNESKKERT